MPYRLDLPAATAVALDRLIDLGAIDAELSPDGGLAVLMPDGVAPAQVARALGLRRLKASPARARDDGSTWVLRPRAVSVGRLRIVPFGDGESAASPAGDRRRATTGAARDTADAATGAIGRDAEGGGMRTIRLADGAAFGTGLHPTTALCLEAISDLVPDLRPDRVLDVGTGSGVLALAALALGASRAVGIDLDRDALRTASGNARLNGLGDRLHLLAGGPGAVTGAWPLVLANVLAAPLIEMAPVLVRRIAHHGDLVLSGIPAAVEPDVDRAYQRLGLVHVQTLARAGWAALVFRASW